VGLHVPILRGDDVTPSDTAVVEDAGQAVEKGLFAAERLARTGLCFGLLELRRLHFDIRSISGTEH